MEPLARVLNWLRKQHAMAAAAPESDYRKGYLYALEDVIEEVQDVMFEEGVDE